MTRRMHFAFPVCFESFVAIDDVVYVAITRRIAAVASDIKGEREITDWSCGKKAAREILWVVHGGIVARRINRNFISRILPF